MSYVVITHNGKMPRDGGLRLGFIAGGKVFALPGVPVEWLVKPAQKAPDVPAGQKTDADGLLIYDELPRCTSPSNRCTRCGTFDTKFVLKRFSDGRRRTVVECKECGTVMRDWLD